MLKRGPDVYEVYIHKQGLGMYVLLDEFKGEKKIASKIHSNVNEIQKLCCVVNIG